MPPGICSLGRKLRPERRWTVPSLAPGHMLSGWRAPPAPPFPTRGHASYASKDAAATTSALGYTVTPHGFRQMGRFLAFCDVMTNLLPTWATIRPLGRFAGCHDWRPRPAWHLSGAQATAPGLYRPGSEQELDIAPHRCQLPDTDSYVFGRYDNESRFRTDQKLQHVSSRSPARLARNVDKERGTWGGGWGTPAG